MAMSLLVGCGTPVTVGTTSKSTAPLRPLTEALDTLLTLPLILNKNFDLLYCLSSFRQKNGRWPNDATELLAYVEKSNGYLFLEKLDKITCTPLTNDVVEVTYLRPGRTNEIKFTLGGGTNGDFTAQGRLRELLQGQGKIK
jgi:hypothetical protein